MYRAGAFDPIVSRSSNYRLPPNFILDLFFLNRDSFFIGERKYRSRITFVANIMCNDKTVQFF